MKILIYALTVSVIFCSNMKEKDIVEFLDAKYSGDTSMVNSFLSEEFLNFHAPFAGLGLNAHYVDEFLLVTEIINDSIMDYINIGDKIHEVNGKVVPEVGIQINGAVGDLQKLVVTKNKDSLFSEINIPLQLLQKKETINSYLNTIKEYSDLWYEYDLQILDFIHKKEKVFVYYNWEGSLKEKGKVYYFTAVEILTIDKKSRLIIKAETLWNELQFKNQFK